MNKAFLILPLIALVTLSFRTVEAPVWEFDQNHSNLGFSVTNMGVTDIEGTFKISEATLVTKGDDFTDASATLVADMSTVDTDNDMRDTHLKTADFFDVEKYPTSTFKSTSFRKTGDMKYEIKGDLTMHGITKPVAFEASVKQAINPMDSMPIVGIKVKGIIKRLDFGISSKTPSNLLSDEIQLHANLKFNKK